MLQWQSKVRLMGVNLDFVLVITWVWDNIQPKHKYGVVEGSKDFLLGGTSFYKWQFWLHENESLQIHSFFELPITSYNK